MRSVITHNTSSTILCSFTKRDSRWRVVFVWGADSERRSWSPLHFNCYFGVFCTFSSYKMLNKSLMARIWSEKGRKILKVRYSRRNAAVLSEVRFHRSGKSLYIFPYTFIRNIHIHLNSILSVIQNAYLIK